MKSRKAFSLVEISIVIVIIGILIAGISKGMDLYADFKLTTARKLTLNSQVARIPDLALWLETTSEKSLQNASDSFSLSDGQNIKNWNDITPTNTQKFVATQATSSLQPFYKKDGIGGLPSVFFDANTTGTSGNGLSIPYSPHLNTPIFTIFIVTQPMEMTSGASAWGTIIMSRYTSSTATGYFLYKNRDQYYDFLTGDGTNWHGINNTPVTFKKPIIATLKQEASTKKFYINSSLKGSSSLAMVTNRFNPLAIGYEYSPLLFYDGYTSEIIYYGRDLKDNERLAVENYLSQKYRIK